VTPAPPCQVLALGEPMGDDRVAEPGKGRSHTGELKGTTEMVGTEMKTTAPNQTPEPVPTLKETLRKVRSSEYPAYHLVGMDGTCT
jgi:hypothetical protein